MRHQRNIKDSSMRSENCQQIKNILERKISGAQKLFRKIADDLEELKLKLNQTGEDTMDPTWNYKDSWKNKDEMDLRE